MLWDLDGHADFDRIRGRYLQGCSGYLMIVDGTRPQTLDAAFRLRDSVQEVSDFPAIWMLNKIDLADQWQLEPDVETSLAESGLEVLTSSAKSGDGVEEAFQRLTARMLLS